MSLVDNENDEYVSIGSVLKKKGITVDEIIIDSENNSLDNVYLKEIDNYHNIIMATLNVAKDDYQVQVYNSLPKEKTTIIAMRSPYDALYLKGLCGYICIYEATTLAINSLCECMLEHVYNGKLPISLDM